MVMELVCYGLTDCVIEEMCWVKGYLRGMCSGETKAALGKSVCMEILNLQAP
jgi:hypothetical protein